MSDVAATSTELLDFPELVQINIENSYFTFSI